jgi:hypothetical protein
MNISETLPIFSLNQSQQPFCNWIISNFEPYIQPRILLICDKDTALAKTLAIRNIPFHLGTQDTENLTQLQIEYKNNVNIRSIRFAESNSENLVQQYSSMLSKFQTILHTGFLANKENLRSYLANITPLLKPNGVTLIIIPSFNIPFSETSINPNELKVLDREYLNSLLRNFTILKLRHFSIAASNHADLQSKEISYIATVVGKTT